MDTTIYVGAGYMTHACDLRNHEPFRSFWGRFGAQGYGVWFILAEYIAEQGAIGWDEDSIQILAEVECEVEKGELIEMVSWLERRGVLAVRDGFLHCDLMRPIDGNDAFAMPSQCHRSTDALVTQCDGNANAVRTESKQED